MRPFDPRPVDRVRKKLLLLTHNKCAYCEQLLDAKFEIENYRPRALEKEEGAEDHYWWLMFTWQNLMPACSQCNRSKRNLFPIAGQRCGPMATGPALLAEKPLMVSPRTEVVDRFFEFDAHGMMAPAPWLPEHDRLRARTTIEVLQLNRPALVAVRLEAMVLVGQLCQRISSVAKTPESIALLNELKTNLTGERSFTAACRWAFLRHHPMLKERIGRSQGYLQLRECAALIHLLTMAKARFSSTTLRAARRRIGRESKLVGDFVSDSISVRSIELRNFRIFKDVQISIPDTRPADVAAIQEMLRLPKTESTALQTTKPRTRGWKMLLGENGSGKSSILHALALALTGNELLTEHASHYRHGLRHGARQGYIRVHFHETDESIEIILDRKAKTGYRWRHGAKGKDVFLRAYGATRLLPNRNGQQVAPDHNALTRKRVSNLFDPFAPLIDAEQWLRGLDKPNLDQACLTLKDLLDIADDDGDLTFSEVLEDGKKVTQFGLQAGKQFVPLHLFSAGYQTIVALGCDIMAGSRGKLLSDMSMASGIIIIDEIGTNLHPGWRMRIIRSLERAFGNMQFIASTHEPLCLHGLGQGEVAVVERKKTPHGVSVEVNDDLPSPAGLRTDQLLTSEFFGLNTTLDPAVEAKFSVYYDLLARGRENLSAQERKYHDQLAEDLNKKTVLGSSRRDQFILRTVDAYLASERSKKNAADRIQATERVRRTIERALSEVVFNEPHQP
ncbi:MAG TPA: AAA family ATPase [Flavobacteriales bacterium]|nr:AAA family ATPase [Flavobacteriales bacterium]